MMWDLILNGATLDVLGLTAFAATVYLLVGRPKRRARNSNESGQDGVK